MKNERLTSAELAGRFGVSVSTVTRRLGEPRAEYLGRAKTRQEHAADLRASGMSYAAIADELDVSIGTVSGLLARARRRPSLDDKGSGR